MLQHDRYLAAMEAAYFDLAVLRASLRRDAALLRKRGQCPTCHAATKPATDDDLREYREAVKALDDACANRYEARVARDAT